jgi:hypothetical protein
MGEVPTTFRRASVFAIILALVLPWTALADDVANDLDATVDAVAENMPLNVGATGTTDVFIQPANGDGKNGCNLTASTTLGVSVASSDVSVATVSPNAVTFTSCGDTKTLTVTALAIGSATVSLTQTSNTSAGTFSLVPATFRVTVAAPSNSAPQISIGGVIAGASYNKGSVPAATCNVTDGEDGNSSFAATLGTITGPYAADGIGQQVATCSYTDDGGLEATDSLTYNIIDPSAPQISYVLDPASPDGTNNWYRSSVLLTWTITEEESPSALSKIGCADQNITADQLSTEYSCSASSAGGSAHEVKVIIKRDGTAPVISDGGATAAPDGTNGWYVSPVTNQFSATDATSGLPSGTSPWTASTTSEGSGVTVSSGSVTDLAGNTATSIDSAGFNVDLSDPTGVAFSGTIADGASYYFGSVPAASTCSANDAISGLAGCVVSGYSTAVGAHTLTATATDNAGRTATAELTYSVLAWTLSGFYQPVDMGGIWNTVRGGSTVPLKFEIFAGTTELTDLDAVRTFNVNRVSCSNSATEAAIEMTTTGGTSLRYDAVGGQFVQNWQTLKQSGSCYSVTMATQDGSALTAWFKLR